MRLYSACSEYIRYSLEGIRVDINLFMHSCSDRDGRGIPNAMGPLTIHYFTLIQIFVCLLRKY